MPKPNDLNGITTAALLNDLKTAAHAHDGDRLVSVVRDLDVVAGQAPTSRLISGLIAIGLRNQAASAREDHK